LQGYCRHNEENAEHGAEDGDLDNTVGISLSFLKEFCTKKVLRLWKKRFKDVNLGSCTHFDMYCTFSAKSKRPTDLIRETGKDQLQTVIAARTGKGYFKCGRIPRIIPHITTCPCGSPLEDVRHILQSCPQFMRDRAILRKIHLRIPMDRILDSDDGQAAIAKFSMQSGAFSRATFFSQHHEP
jgi:hypothetical protein